MEVNCRNWPLKVEAGRLRSLIGSTGIHEVRGRHALAVIDQPLQTRG